MGIAVLKPIPGFCRMGLEIFTYLWMKFMMHICQYSRTMEALVNDSMSEYHSWSYTLIYSPGTQMTSIFEGQPPQNKVFSHQNNGHLGSRH